jgi:hypothetical protein
MHFLPRLVQTETAWRSCAKETLARRSYWARRDIEAKLLGNEDLCEEQARGKVGDRLLNMSCSRISMFIADDTTSLERQQPKSSEHQRNLVSSVQRRDVPETYDIRCESIPSLRLGSPRQHLLSQGPKTKTRPPRRLSRAQRTIPPRRSPKPSNQRTASPANPRHTTFPSAHQTTPRHLPDTAQRQHAAQVPSARYPPPARRPCERSTSSSVQSRDHRPPSRATSRPT